MTSSSRETINPCDPKAIAEEAEAVAYLRKKWEAPFLVLPEDAGRLLAAVRSLLKCRDFQLSRVLAEREACASLAMGITGPGNTVEDCHGYSNACREIAAAIRARGNDEIV